MDKATDNTADINTDLEQAKIICPCCGQPTLDKELKISDTLMDHFVSCILTHVPFFHTYSLYHDRIKITCTQLYPADADLNRDVALKLRALVADEVISESFAISLSNSVNLAYHIKEIQVVDSNNTNTYYYPSEYARNAATKIMKVETKDVEEDTIKAALVECLESITDPAILSSVPISMLAHTEQAHARVYELLLEAGFDSNFWEGIELA